MRFNSAFISTFLLAPAVLAAGHHKRADHVRRSADSDFQVVTLDNWAGAVLEVNVSSVSGTFTVPHPTSPSGSGAAIWVGMGGYKCLDSILQTGITVAVDGNGQGLCESWAELWPYGDTPYANVAVSSGDTVKVSVIAFSDTVGMTKIENLSNGQSGDFTLGFNDGRVLCTSEAEWIVESYHTSTGLEPVTEFGSVDFDISVTGSDGNQHTLADGPVTVIDMVQQGEWLATTFVSSTTVGVTRM